VFLNLLAVGVVVVAVGCNEGGGDRSGLHVASHVSPNKRIWITVGLQ
jgi:hypothetical protein